MRLLRFTLREPDRGRRRFRSREWWCSGYLPRFWNRTCSPDCRVGTTYEWEDEAGDARVSTRDHSENCPRSPKYLGHVAKGWWHLWTLRDPLWRWETQLVFAVGGEDNMAQLSLNLPIIGRFAVGVKVPRSWTKPWVYNRREFGFELRGLWPTVLLGFDGEAKDMRGYYRGERRGSTCLSCGAPKWAHEIPEPTPDDPASPVVGPHREYEKVKDCPGFKFGLPPYVTRIGLIYGLKFELRSSWRWGRVKNRLLGKVEMTDTVLKVYDPATVTLPEGDYVGKVTFYRSKVKRSRWRTIRDDVYGKFETDIWMPWPGKGENSWDCGDDGTREHTERVGAGRMSEHEINGEDVAKVIAGTVATVLRFRARYGRFDWQPEGVGVMRN